MKIVCLQKNLKQGVFVTSHITGRNVNLPILNNLMIQADNNTIKLISTNLEIGITNTIRGKIEEPGSFTVDAKTLSDYVNLLPNQKVEINIEKENLAIQSENYKTKIKGQSAEEYPLIPEITKDNYYSVKIDELKKAISNVVFAVSADENRLALSGVLFNIEKDSLTLVATDSYRLAEKKIKINSNVEDDEVRKIIIPTRTLQELTRIMSGDYSDSKENQEIKFYLSDNQVLFELNGVEIVSRLIEAQYPDYQQIIPRKEKTTVILERQELTRAIKACSIFSKTGINDVTLDFLKEKQQVITSAISGQTGENVTNLNAKIEGSDNNITINSRYLLDGLNNINSDMVKIQLVDGNTPCLIQPTEENADYLYIVMPIKK